MQIYENRECFRINRDIWLHYSYYNYKKELEPGWLNAGSGLISVATLMAGLAFAVLVHIAFSHALATGLASV